MWCDRVIDSLDKTDKHYENKLCYYLYLAGIAAEVMAGIQKIRKSIGLTYTQIIDVGLDIPANKDYDKVTSAVIIYAKEIKERANIRRFSPNPMTAKSYSGKLPILDYKNKKWDIDYTIAVV